MTINRKVCDGTSGGSKVSTVRYSFKIRQIPQSSTLVELSKTSQEGRTSVLHQAGALFFFLLYNVFQTSRFQEPWFSGSTACQCSLAVAYQRCLLWYHWRLGFQPLLDSIKSSLRFRTGLLQKPRSNELHNNPSENNLLRLFCHVDSGITKSPMRPARTAHLTFSGTSWSLSLSNVSIIAPQA